MNDIRCVNSKKYLMLMIIIILFVFYVSNIVKAVEKLDAKESFKNLKQLQLNKEGIVPKFQSDIYEYYLTVLNDVNEIQVTAIPENSDAIVEISGNTNLKEGNNDIIIKIIINGNIQTIYTIHVIKTNNIELANTNLENLAIENVLLNPSFDKNILKYTADVSYNKENLNILAVTENEKAQLRIEGNNNLKQGENVIEIVVTAPNNITEKKYLIVVNKRSQQQEEIYQEEEKTKKRIQTKQLENAYRIERTSADIDLSQSNNINKKKENIIIIVFIIVSIISLCIVLIYKIL